jgi:hypothetical protein
MHHLRTGRVVLISIGRRLVVGRALGQKSQNGSSISTEVGFASVGLCGRHLWQLSYTRRGAGDTQHQEIRRRWRALLAPVLPERRAVLGLLHLGRPAAGSVRQAVRRRALLQLLPPARRQSAAVAAARVISCGTAAAVAAVSGSTAARSVRSAQTSLCVGCLLQEGGTAAASLHRLLEARHHKLRGARLRPAGPQIHQLPRPGAAPA